MFDGIQINLLALHLTLMSGKAEEKVNTIVTKISDNEKELFRVKGKTYRFDVSEWKERGEGDIVIAKSEKVSRVLLHRDLTGKCAINFQVEKGIEVSNLNGNAKAITVSCLDFSDDAKGKPTVFAFRFKEEEKANAFKKMLCDIKDGKEVSPVVFEEKKEDKKEDKTVEG